MGETAAWPAGGGETGALIRAHDWSRTPLGPADAWPQSLRTAVDIMLASPVPTSVLWGPEHVQLYNDAYVAVARERHPAILGRPALEGWADARDVIAPILRDVFSGAAPAVLHDIAVPLLRPGGTGTEMRTFRASFSPIADESGRVAGIFHPLQETTGVVEALRESEERLRLTLGAADLGIWEHDLGTDLFHLDARAQALYGLGPVADVAALLGQVHPGDRERLGGEFQAAMDPAVRGPVSTEYRVVHGDGAERWLRVKGRVYFSETGAGPRPLRGLGTVQDVTDERRAQETLRESEARFRLMADAVPQIVWITDAAGRTEFFNRQWTTYTGRPYEPSTAAEIAATAVHPDDAEVTMRRFEEARRAAASFEVEHRICSASGEYRWFLVRGEPYRDEATGEIVRWFGSSTDIHDRRVAEEALRQREEHLRLALDVAELGTWSWDLVTGAGEIDARGAEIVGLAPGHLENVAEAQRDSIHPDDLGRVEAAVGAGLESGRAFDLVYRAVHPDGSLRHVASRAHVLRDEAGRPVRLMGTNRDATAEREAEARLRESEARYRTLFESMDEGFCVIEMIFDEQDRPVDYRFLEANPAFVGQTGLRDAIGRTVREMVPGHETYWFEIYGRVARTGEPVRFENRAQALGRWYDVFAFRVGEPPEPPTVAVLFSDISEYHRVEEERERLVAALEVERERLVEVIRRAPAFMVVLRGPDHVLELVNDAYQQLIGHRAVTGKPLFEAVPEARGQGFEPLLDAVLETGEPFSGTGLPIRLQRTPGAPLEERIMDLAYVPLTEADGTRTGVLVLGTDVTEQTRARREIESARDRAERLQTLTAALARARTLDDVADVVVADMVVALGARTGALAGRAPEGDALLVLRTIGFPEPVKEGVRRQGLDERTPLIECFRTRTPLWLESRAGPHGLDARFPAIAPVWEALGVSSAVFVPLVAAGETVGVISFAWAEERIFPEEERDFLLALGGQAALAVERARLFGAEHAARAEAERANRAKSEFLAVMSHELRTPLNAIGGYAELMEMGIRGPITPQQREDLRRVQTSQRHLLGLINEVLNYAKLETGTVHYDVADVRVRDALAGAEALVSPQAQAKELTLVIPPCDPALAVRADAEKVRQILVNLLSNAVKFTDRGGRVEVECAESGDRVHILVRDTGIGIPADQLDRIFEPFVQVRADLTRTAEGTGLGLAISRDLARGMGGDLTAESTLGIGSTFTLSLLGA